MSAQHPAQVGVVVGNQNVSVESRHSRNSVRVGCRKSQRERCPIARFAFCPDAPAVSLHNLLYNRKSQTRTGGEVMGLRRPIESLENAFAIPWQIRRASWTGR